MRKSIARMFGVRQVRTRLTVWYIGVLAGVLLLSWALTASFLFLQLRNQLDHYAIQDIETVEGLLYLGKDGSVQLRDDYHNHPESRQVLERYLEVFRQKAAFSTATSDSAAKRSEDLLSKAKGWVATLLDPPLYRTAPRFAWSVVVTCLTDVRSCCGWRTANCPIAPALKNLPPRCLWFWAW